MYEGQEPVSLLLVYAPPRAFNMQLRNALLLADTDRHQMGPSTLSMGSSPQMGSYRTLAGWMTWCIELHNSCGSSVCASNDRAFLEAPFFRRMARHRAASIWMRAPAVPADTRVRGRTYGSSVCRMHTVRSTYLFLPTNAGAAHVDETNPVKPKRKEPF